MKVDAKAVASLGKRQHNETAILTLVPETVKYPKDKLLQFKLRTTPGDADSPTYELTVPKISGQEGVRETIKWTKAIMQVFVGMNATTADQRNQLVRRALCDQADTAYERGLVKHNAARFANDRQAAYQAAIDNGDDVATAEAAANAVAAPVFNIDDVNAGIEEIMNYVVPFKGLQRQKRFMRRKCRKPMDMTAREFYNHFIRMNDQELPSMPPLYNATQRLTDDEVTDILLYAFPASWSAEMAKQGFDPFSATSMRVLEFCERMEASEEVFQPTNKNGKASGNNKGSSKKKSSGGQHKSGGQYYCLHHGKNTSHDTNDCQTLKNSSKKMKSGDDNKGKHANKTWSRKAEQSKDKSKKELAALMRKTVRDELNAINKKRKESDEDSVASVNQIDDVDLSQFNYMDMDKLKIDTDDSDFDDEELKTEVET